MTKSTNLKDEIIFALSSNEKYGLSGPLFTNSSGVMETISLVPNLLQIENVVYGQYVSHQKHHDIEQLCLFYL